MPSTTPAAALERLARAVSNRRTQLGMTKISVADQAGITITTYGNVEAGRSVRDTTYGKIEPVLGWAVGSCSDVLKGGNPTVIEAGPNGTVISPVFLGDLQSAVERAVQDAAVATTDLPASEIRKMKQRVVDELIRQGKIPEAPQG